MDNILKYLTWRGDISFKERAFNELDALVCALLGYIVWDDIVKKETILLKEACRTYCQLHKEEELLNTYAYSPLLINLVRVLQDVPRYNEVKLSRYISNFDDEKDVQFAATTITLPDNSLYISFRGTDSSILGWKEDFEMLYKEYIPCQKLAVEYLQDTYKEIFSKKNVFGLKKKKPTLYIGGHSKGGNIAMYGAICCIEIQPYITKVYSFDGPGFRESFYQEHDHSKIIDRITNYAPVSSIIGRLMLHKEKYKIFDGYASGLQQHDGFYWKVDRDHFVTVDGFNRDSDNIQQYIEKVLSSKTDEETKEFITFIFKVLHDMKVKNITDFTDLGLKESILGIKELAAMNQEERKFFLEVIKLTFSQTKSILSVMANKSKVLVES